MVRRIAQTAHSEVYLVRHIQLSVYRIAKVVSKSHRDCERILREADIIKNIKHIGIPLVYDIEEDSDSICIIEEYIAGNSLSEYIAKERLSVAQMAIISIKICEVLEYLHNCEDIIHMDLKPENIIIRKRDVADKAAGKVAGKVSGKAAGKGSGKVTGRIVGKISGKAVGKGSGKVAGKVAGKISGKVSGKAIDNKVSDMSLYDVSIIDFDSSVFIGEPAVAYGSVGFAAPEQYKASVDGTNQSADRPTECFAGGISARTDCYSMGMLLLYMACEGHMQSMAENVDNVCALYSDTIGPVIKKCIRHNQSQRFNSIEELKKELIKVLNQENNKNVNTKNAYDIYVYGIKHGVGATHVSLCLAAFLKRFFVGKKVLYIRHGDREDIFLEAVKGRLTVTGAYKSHGIYIMPDYGDCIRCDLSDFDVIVHDCGVAGCRAADCVTYVATDGSVTCVASAECRTYVEADDSRTYVAAADCVTYVAADGSGTYVAAADGKEYITADTGEYTGEAAQHADKSGNIIYVGDCGYRNSDIAFMNNISNIGRETSVFINHISGKAFYNFIRDNQDGGKAVIMKKDKKSPVRYYRMPCMYEWYESNKLFEEAVIEALRLDKTKC